MNIYISWSGQTSREVALDLRIFITSVMQRTKIYITSEDAFRESKWILDLPDKIRSSDFAIACITKENINNPWLAVEIGALTMTMEPTRFTPVLVDLSLSELSGPLAYFQAVRLEKTDLRKLLYHINSISEAPIPDSIFDQLFYNLWPSFEEKTQKIKNREIIAKEEIRIISKGTPDSIMKELLIIKERLDKLEGKDT